MNDDRLLTPDEVTDAVAEYFHAEGFPPAEEASRDLWPDVAKHVTASVIAITPDRRRRFRMIWAEIGPVAAALVLVTVGATYTIMRRFGTVNKSETAVESLSSAEVRVFEPPVVHQEVIPPDPAPGEDQMANLAAPGAATAEGKMLNQVQRLPSLSEVEYGPTDRTPAVVYVREIDKLLTIVRARREQLDSATMQTLERNLQIIDKAIAESRSALAEDPNSRFLSDQLDRALEQKISLLRVAAMLPSDQ